jgi:Flp pilus assembly protein TadD
MTSMSPEHTTASLKAKDFVRHTDQNEYAQLMEICQGNAAFKAGDFPASIGHYTSAILADPNNPTFYLNRAAAYLKLGKYVACKSSPFNCQCLPPQISRCRKRHLLDVNNPEG